ncbi:MAG TPA: c-type cytochrome, partial [Candidatus Acidoferrum sp.]|nr:c-type cytochrome [Candidatus Acidoferrum sp.]
AVLAFHSASAQQAQKSPAKDSPAATSRSGGRQMFESTCAPCHGLDGRGGERAPDIATRPEVTRLSDQALLKILREGIPEKGMPPFAALGSAKLSALLSYVQSLQGKGIEAPVGGDAGRGKELFWGKAGCSGCHMVNGAGGFLGRDLSNYGENHSVTEVRAVIVKPEITIGTRGHVAEVTAKDGKSYSGLVRNEDNFSLQLQSLDGTFHFFSKSDLAAISYRQESLMPADYGTKLSPAELDALAAYLASIARMKQKRRDEFEY